MESFDLPRFGRTTRHIENEPCANCGTHYSGNFCPHCGQEGYTGAPTAWGFLYEYLTHNVFENGKLPRTLWHLLRYPGGLTVDFLEGRRERYVRPVRLFLGLLLVNFAIIFCVGDTWVEQFAKFNQGMAEAIMSKHGADKNKVGSEHEQPLFSRLMLKALNWYPEGAKKQQVERKVREFAALGTVKAEVEVMRMTTSPAMEQRINLVMVPVTAMLLHVWFRHRKINFGAHFLFVLHYSAFGFLIGLPLLIWPIGYTVVYGCWSLAYLLVALHRVYAISWKQSVMPLVGIGIVYSAISSLMARLMLAINLFT